MPYPRNLQIRCVKKISYSFSSIHYTETSISYYLGNLCYEKLIRFMNKWWKAFLVMQILFLIYVACIDVCCIFLWDKKYKGWYLWWFVVTCKVDLLQNVSYWSKSFANPKMHFVNNCTFAKVPWCVGIKIYDNGIYSVFSWHVCIKHTDPH